MMTPIEEKKDEKIRMGMVQVSDGKSRPRPARLLLTMESVTVQREVVVQPQPPRDKTVPHARERMVQITRQKVGGLGLSIKGGAEHKLPILISKIYKDQAADQTGQLFVGDAVIKVNGEYITACKHDDAVNILRNAGDIVVLTVKHYRAATPFLQKQADGASDTDSSTGDDHPSHKTDANCNTETNGGWQSADDSRPGSAGSARSRPPSVASECLTENRTETTEWVDVVSVPLMMGYVTRYVFGTDKLRPGAFEVRGARPHITSGVIHVEDPAALSHWLKSISDNIMGLTNLQMKLLNRHLAAGERIEYMGWVHEGVVSPAQPWQTYRPRFLVLKGTDVMLFDVPPMNTNELAKCPESLKVYATLFRSVKESETVDWRQHCFLLQSGAAGAPHPRYFSADTRHELLRLDAAWTACLVAAVVRLGKKTFTVVHGGRAAGLTLDWASGFSLSEGTPGAPPVWSYSGMTAKISSMVIGQFGTAKLRSASVETQPNTSLRAWLLTRRSSDSPDCLDKFSQLRGSSDDGKSKLKLHFQDSETKVIETKELECQILQSLLFCMHAFLTAKVASVDPAFLASIHQSN